MKKLVSLTAITLLLSGFAAHAEVKTFEATAPIAETSGSMAGSVRRLAELESERDALKQTLAFIETLPALEGRLLTDTELTGLVLRLGKITHREQASGNTGGESTRTLSTSLTLDTDQVPALLKRIKQEHLLFKSYKQLALRHDQLALDYRQGLSASSVSGATLKSLNDRYQATELLENALRAYEGNKAQSYQQMRDLAGKVVSLEPDYAFGYSTRALAAQLLQDYPAANSDYSRAIKINGLEPAFYAQRGYVRALLKQSNMAIEDLSASARQDSSNPYTYNNRGTVYSADGNPDYAIDDFTRAISLDNTVSAFFVNRARAFETKGNWGAAFDDYNAALRLDPRNASLYHRRGQALFQLKNYDRAVESYARAMQLGMRNAEIYLARGEAYAARLISDQALNDLERAISLDPANAKAYAVRAKVYERLQDYDGMLSDYTQLVKLQPKNAQAWLMRGKIYEHKGKFALALADLNKAVALAPNNGEAYFFRGQAHRELKRCDLSNQDFDKACKLGFELACRHRCIDTQRTQVRYLD